MDERRHKALEKVKRALFSPFTPAIAGVVDGSWKIMDSESLVEFSFEIEIPSGRMCCFRIRHEKEQLFQVWVTLELKTPPMTQTRFAFTRSFSQLGEAFAETIRTLWVEDLYGLRAERARDPAISRVDSASLTLGECGKPTQG